MTLETDTEIGPCSAAGRNLHCLFVGFWSTPAAANGRGGKVPMPPVFRAGKLTERLAFRGREQTMLSGTMALGTKVATRGIADSDA